MKEAIILASLLVLAPLAHAQSMPGMSMDGAKDGMAAGQGTAMPPKNISVQDCWIRLLPGSAPSAGYFTIENSGDQPASLAGAHADAFGMAMLHETHKDSKGVMGMSAVRNVPVPAKGRLAFAPGGYHVMLEKPARSLHVGDKVALPQVFGVGQALTTQCEARTPAGAAK